MLSSPAVLGLLLFRVDTSLSPLLNVAVDAQLSNGHFCIRFRSLSISWFSCCSPFPLSYLLWNSGFRLFLSYPSPDIRMSLGAVLRCQLNTLHCVEPSRTSFWSYVQNCKPAADCYSKGNRSLRSAAVRSGIKGGAAGRNTYARLNERYRQLLVQQQE